MASLPALQSFWSLIQSDQLPDLGPGPRRGVRSSEAIREELRPWFANHPITPHSIPRLMATALLYHDQHDAAHDLVQDLTDADGVLIHALLHRREPDYWNAKYWFRRLTNHPIYREVTTLGRDFSQDPQTSSWLSSLSGMGRVDPIAMVDLCEAVAKRPPNDPQVCWLQRLQHLEFKCLAGHLIGDSNPNL